MVAAQDNPVPKAANKMVCPFFAFPDFIVSYSAIGIVEDTVFPQFSI